MSRPPAERRFIRITTRSPPAGTDPSPSPFFSRPQVREVHKNAYLRRLKNDEKRVGRRSGEKTWVVFCIHDDRDAFLEFYATPQAGATHLPTECLSLNNCLHITPALVGADEFTITLPFGAIRLLAQSWDQMMEWVDALQSELRELNIFQPKSNLYSTPPELRLSKIKDRRNPNRDPLPPTPATSSIAAGSEHQNSSDPTRPPKSLEIQPTPSDNVYELLFLSDAPSTVIDTTESPPPIYPRSDLMSKTRITDTSNGHRSSSSISQPSTSSQSSNQNQYRHSQTSPVLSDHPLEGMLGVRGGEYRIRREEENITTNVPLKEAQVARLETEMSHETGVRLVLRKRDLCGDSLALINYQGGVFVAGWKQRDHPYLYFAFHVGDQLLKVDGVEVTSSEDTFLRFRSTSSTDVEIILRRLPYGRVWVLKRTREGEPLGLVAEGGSAEISEVLEGGLAWKSGVRPSETGENWILTEINHRPLSLFVRDSEVKERLNAVGREISILVQTAKFVHHLRKGLKHVKNFKDYGVG